MTMHLESYRNYRTISIRIQCMVYRCGKCAGVWRGDPAMMEFMSAEMEQLKPIVKREKIVHPDWADNGDLCQRWGGDRDEEDCKDTEMNPRSLTCWECGEVGHNWPTCDLLVSLSDKIPFVCLSELFLESWEHYCRKTETCHREPSPCFGIH